MDNNCKYFFLTFLGIILFGSLSSALTVDIPIPINYSLIPTVNASEYWVTSIGALDNVNATQFDNNGGTLSIDESWISSWAGGLYCLLTGCTMSGDIDLDGNNILNGNSITSDYVQVGDELNVYGDSYLNNTYPQSSLSSSLGSGALRWLNLFVQNINAEEIDAFNMHLSENLTVDGNVTANNFIGNFSGSWDGAEDYWLRDGDSVASGDWDLGVYDFIAQYINATADLDVMDDLFVYDDTSLYDDFEVWGLSDFFGATRFNHSISLTTTFGDAILEIETENSSESSELRLLADGTNDLYIYTYGSTAPATYYGLPRASTSYVDARGERFVLGTFDTSPMYFATSQEPRFILTGAGNLIPYDDEYYDIGNSTNRLRDLYIKGEEVGGIHFVEDDGSYGNLSMDDDFNLLWNGNIIVNSTGEGGFIGNPFDQSLNTTDNVTFNNITLGQKIIFALGETIDNLVNGWLRITGNLEVTGDLNVTGYIDGKGYVTQYHRNATINTASADTWVNITWDLTIDEETTSGYSLTDSNVSINIENTGIYRVQGCLHPKNNGVGNQEASLYSRVLINGVEAKCLQFANSKEFKTTGIDTMPFTGTVYAEAGQKIQLQYYVTSVNIDFEGDAVFEDGVAGSINLERLSK